MQTSAFITYMADYLSTSYSRANILDMANNAQNEILAHPNELTRITPDPHLHTGMTAILSGAGNSSGDGTFVVASAIPTTVPTAGYLLITESSTTTKYKYVSYSSATFTLADGVVLTSTYTENVASCTIDNFDIIASGAIFSSVANSRTTQWDVRTVERVYTYRDSTYMTRQYGREIKTSYNPDVIPNYNDNIQVPRVSVINSVEPDSDDCRIVWWEENDPGITTAVYYASAQRWPTQLSAETVSLTIPDRFQREVLKWAILKNAEYKAYGRDDRPEEKYERSLKEFITATAQKAQIALHQTTPRF